MSKKLKEAKKTGNQDFIKEYNKIFEPASTSVIVETEWTKKGDYFQKLTMYDNNYVPVPTLDGTTLIDKN